ncbi:LysM peptidoglycan-binding domain-containing protein [Candidatus Woesearchaeota archaeon]|nr:LysM peptidoglycan-binding domain-containing protein [Candidatus Woesearchaeota archaeon]
MMRGAKAFTLGSLALITAPAWLPIALAGYLIGYTAVQTSRFVFKHPGWTIGALGIAGIIAYDSTPERMALRNPPPIIQEVVTPAPEIVEPPQMVSPPKIIPPEIPKMGIIKEEGTVYYHVRQDDTLLGIASEQLGNPALYTQIMEKNGITDSRKLITGTRLRIPEELCGPCVGTYRQVPELTPITIPGSENISERFENLEDILSINKALGLDYTDKFTYSRGERIVWVPDGYL